MNDDHANLEARPGVSVIIVNYNGGTELLDCVEALEHEAPLAEVLVVDNASVDGSAHACTRRFPHVRVLYSEENLGFAGGANLGAAHATTGIFVFLNPDTMPGPGCMSQLYEELSARGGVAGPLVSHEGQSLVEQGLTIDRMGLARGLTEPSPVLYVSGCCLGTTRECFEAVGGLDDRYFLFCEDIEYCWQALRRGYDVRVVPTATLKHVGGTAAPGGYRRNNRIETTSVRILLGGRNSLAMFLACAPLWVMPGLICASLLRSGFFAALLLTNRRPRDAARLITGICWNVEQLPATRRRRHRPGVTPAGERAAWARVSRRLFLWDHMRAGERARFVDAPRGQRPSPGVPTASLQGAKNPRGGKPADPSAEGFAEQ
jgi:GT2 family glycosyltransferase